MKPEKFLITDSEALKAYYTQTRNWQGIPSIEVTRKGRIFAAHYTGETGEMLGNYVALYYSDNEVDFTEPIAVFYAGKDRRCFDPALWLDKSGTLWVFVAVQPDLKVYAWTIADPDAKELVWSGPRKVGDGVMMNKPTMLSSGRILFPLAVWPDDRLRQFQPFGPAMADKFSPRSAACAVASDDGGNRFYFLGGATGINRSFDEHLFLELKDGTVAMFTRTTYGIGISHSRDGGKTWEEIEDSHLGGPDSRFHIRRLPSGRILLVNHNKYNGRTRLAAMLSEDDGKTFPYCLLLDERRDVSYPDAGLHGGAIHIVYDRERYGAKEILMARVTEDDIIAGSLTDKNSYLKRVINKIPEKK